MKKLVYLAALVTMMSVQGFATVDTMRTVYLPAFSEESETGFAAVAVPVIEVVGIPHLAIPRVMEREYLIPMVGGGSNTLDNVNAMAGAVVTLDNHDRILDGTDDKVSGVTVDLSAVRYSDDPGFIAAVKEAVAKTFLIKQDKVTLVLKK